MVPSLRDFKGANPTYISIVFLGLLIFLLIDGNTF